MAGNTYGITASTTTYSLYGAGGQRPFSAGVGLPKGNKTYPEDCRAEWSDGSCKFAVVSGYTKGYKSSVSPAEISYQINGQAVKPETLIKEFASEVMTERHYKTLHDGLLVLFYVRQYSQGEQHVTVAIENGWLEKVTETKTVNGYELYRNTRIVDEWWHGEHATAKQNRAELIASGLVPNYAISPDAPGSNYVYVPMTKGNHTASMGATGYQDQIGLLPRWDADYIASGNGYQGVLENAKALGSYGIVWRNLNDEIINPADYPKWTVSGDRKGGVNNVGRGNLVWERAHFPSTGYLAYLLTGNQVYLDNLAHTAALCYLVQNWSYGGGEGIERLDLGQIRGQAWCWRSIGMYTALTGDSGIKARFDYNMNHYAALIDQNAIGLTRQDSAYGKGRVGPWQENFRVQTLGFLSDIEATTDPALSKLRDFNYKFVIGLTSCLLRAGSYVLQVGPLTMDTIDDYWSWPQIWDGVDCGNDLNNPTATNYWANLLPAYSYAVKHGATEDKLKDMPGYPAWMSKFKSNAVWGVK